MQNSWLSVMALALTLLVSTRLDAQVLDIPNAPDSLTRAGNAIVLALPASGGYEINRQPVSLEDLASQFRAIYQPRPRKVLLVTWEPGRSEREVAAVVRLAQAQGVTVYRALVRSREI